MLVTEQIVKDIYELAVVKSPQEIKAEQRQLDRDIAEYVKNSVDEGYMPMRGLADSYIMPNDLPVKRRGK